MKGDVRQPEALGIFNRDVPWGS